MQATLTYSEHAEERMALRGFSYDDVEFVIAHGKRTTGADARHYFLRQSDLRLHQYREWSRLTGTAVVLSLDESTVVTVFRPADGLKGIRRKCQEFQRRRAA